MDKIGIMQGRVLPESLDRLQLFPISKWQAELLMIKDIGFDYFEILFDAQAVCQKLLSDQRAKDLLGITFKPGNAGPICKSMCIDYLTTFSAIKDFKRFFDTITSIVDLVSETTLEVLVLPFLGHNTLKTPQGLETLLRHTADKGMIDLFRRDNLKCALEVDLPAFQVAPIFRKLGLDDIGICYDLGNARSMGFDPAQEIIELNDLIYHIHVKDRKINGPNVMLGEGAVDFGACVDSLNTIKFSGLLILETGYFKEPQEEAKRNLTFIKEKLSDHLA